MPYIELRNYSDEQADLTKAQRNGLIASVTDHLAQGGGADGTFEFAHVKRENGQNFCEYDYIMVIDAGRNKVREDRISKIARKIGVDIEPILGTDSFAVRLRLQDAAFVPFQPEL